MSGELRVLKETLDPKTRKLRATWTMETSYDIWGKMLSNRIAGTENLDQYDFGEDKNDDNK